jgi:hypothetical protein
MKTRFILIFIIYLFSIKAINGKSPSIFDEKAWTSREGRTIQASLISSLDGKVTLKLVKTNKIHTLNLDLLSKKDQDLISDNKNKTSELIKSHNLKVEGLPWSSYWWDYSVSTWTTRVPELAIDEIRLIYAFGLMRDLEIFAVRFTAKKTVIDTEKSTATIMGEEGFAVKAKADSDWVFAQSGRHLKVKPRKIEKGSGEEALTVFTDGVGERLLFPNGRSISEGTIGLTNCLLLSLDNFEPRRSR